MSENSYSSLEEKIPANEQDIIPYKRTSLDRSRDKWLVRFLILFAIFFVGCLTWRGTNLTLGERTQGTITAHGQHGVCYYMFQVDGEWYFGSGEVPFDYKPHPIGSTLEVRYARSHPDSSTIEDPFFPVKQLLFVIALVGAVFLFRHIERKRAAGNTHK